MINLTLKQQASQKDYNCGNGIAPELPSVNSTTSLSDNVNLKNYYDKLLFKNNSGKSLTDLPATAAAAAAAAQSRSNKGHMGEVNSRLGMTAGKNSNDKTINPVESDVSRNIDFINGFKSFTLEDSDNGSFHNSNSQRLSFSAFEMTASNSEPYPYMGNFSTTNQPNNFNNQSLPVQQNAGGTNDPVYKTLFGFGFEGQQKPQENIGYAGISSSIDNSGNYYVGQPNNTNLSPTDVASPLHSSGNQMAPGLQQKQQQSYQYLETARRSSYISDALIHGHTQAPPNGGSMRGSIFSKQPANVPQGRNYSISGAASNGYPPNTAPAVANMNQVSYNQFRRNSQPYLSTTVPSTATSNQNYRYMQYSQQLHSNTVEGFTSKNQQSEYLNNMDNGLKVVNGVHLLPSEDLKKLYLDCGSNYFSSTVVYDFMDHIKNMITSNAVEGHNPEDKSALSFLNFLKNCNSNYLGQYDSPGSKLQGQKTDLYQESINHKTNRRNSSSANGNNSYMNYKPLLLVTLKNGKLELLSVPDNANLLMQRGDMVIIDGDRGKDLALVVEPIVDLDLALFIYFLKKKIHFDSLITSKSQHYPNDKFVQALMESARGQGDKLNSKLYDVIELTQLVIPSKQVIRFATPWEVTTNLHNKFQDELKALNVAKIKLTTLNNSIMNQNATTPDNAIAENPELLQARFTLNITILNAEFQFDRKKLTFYYICEERNDFRDLIKELFKLYKTRIWLCAIPNNLDIYSKYYDIQKKELTLYQNMIQNYGGDDVVNSNYIPQNKNVNGYVTAPPLNAIELDNFQIGVYKELVEDLFY